MGTRVAVDQVKIISIQVKKKRQPMEGEAAANLLEVALIHHSQGEVSKSHKCLIIQ
jgi:hypothetical protein